MKQPISPEELKELMDSGKPDLKVIDVRSPDEYQVKHLTFAENLPASELDHSARKELNPSDTIVCVCNKGHERSQNAADKLSEMGYENVFYLEGGMLGWFDRNVQ